MAGGDESETWSNQADAGFYVVAHLAPSKRPESTACSSMKHPSMVHRCILRLCSSMMSPCVGAPLQISRTRHRHLAITIMTVPSTVIVFLEAQGTVSDIDSDAHDVHAAMTQQGPQQGAAMDVDPRQDPHCLQTLLAASITRPVLSHANGTAGSGLRVDQD